MSYHSYAVAQNLPDLGLRSVGALGFAQPGQYSSGVLGALGLFQPGSFRSGSLGAAPAMRDISRERVLASFENVAAKLLTPDQLATFRPCMARQPAGVVDSEMGNACIAAAKKLLPGAGAPGTGTPTGPDANAPTTDAGMTSGTKYALIAGGILAVLGLGYVLMK